MSLPCSLLQGSLLSSTQLVLVSGLNRSLGMSDELFVLGDSVIIAALVNVRRGGTWHAPGMRISRGHRL